MVTRICKTCECQFEMPSGATRPGTYCSHRCAKWKGGLTKHGDGHMRRLVHGHPRADQEGRVLEHILIAERALGKPLPPKAVVHHANNNGLDNRPENLVICEDQSYHMILHQRQRIVDSGGDPNIHKRCSKCHACLKFDRFTRNASTWDGLHPECKTCKYSREGDRKRRKRAEAGQVCEEVSA